MGMYEYMKLRKQIDRVAKSSDVGLKLAVMSDAAVFGDGCVLQNFSQNDLIDLLEADNSIISMKNERALIGLATAYSENDLMYAFLNKHFNINAMTRDNCLSLQYLLNSNNSLNTFLNAISRDDEDYFMYTQNREFAKRIILARSKTYIGSFSGYQNMSSQYYNDLFNTNKRLIFRGMKVYNSSSFYCYFGFSRNILVSGYGDTVDTNGNKATIVGYERAMSALKEDFLDYNPSSNTNVADAEKIKSMYGMYINTLSGQRDDRDLAMRYAQACQNAYSGTSDNNHKVQFVFAAF